MNYNIVIVIEDIFSIGEAFMAKKEQSKNPTKGLQLWKVVGVFALVFAAVQLTVAGIKDGANFLMELINANDNARAFIGSTISHTSMIAATILITAPVIRSVLNKPGVESLYPRAKNWWKDLLAGMGISSAALLFVFLVELALGWISIIGLAFDGAAANAWLQAIWVALLFNLTISVVEEVLFHGLLLQGTIQAWDKWGALFISSIIFGGYRIIDIGINDTNWLQFIPLMALPGVIFGWAYLCTGNLWLATGLNLAWNIWRGDILNLTGAHSEKNLFGFITSVTGPKWFVGTSFGIEFGAAGILGLVLVTAGIWWWTRNKLSSIE